MAEAVGKKGKRPPKERTKEQRIKAEKRRLLKTFEGAGKTKLDIARPLIEHAAFMRITLDDLAKDVNENGPVEEYQNGKNQNGCKASAAFQGYTSMIKQYAGVCERLDRMLPVSAGTSKLTAFRMSDE